MADGRVGYMWLIKRWFIQTLNYNLYRPDRIGIWRLNYSYPFNKQFQVTECRKDL